MACLETDRQRDWQRGGALWLALSAMLTFWGACASPAFESDDPDAVAMTIAGVVRSRFIDQDDGSSVVEYSLLTESLERVRLRFAVDPELVSGSEVELWGDFRYDNSFNVTGYTLLDVEKRIDGPLSRRPVHHRVAVLATPTVALSASDVTSRMDEVAKFFAETTRGVDTFSLAEFRTYDVAYSSEDCLRENSEVIADRLLAAFEQAGFDASSYQHIATIIPSSCGSDWSGAWGQVGSIRDDATLRFPPLSMFKDSAFIPRIIAHEIGHNLAMSHAQSASCGTQLYAPTLSGCSISEYGDYNDPMGNGWSYWNAPHQRFLGWIGAGRIATVGGSGTFNLIPVDAAQGCGIQGLRIPVPNESGKYFYLEYRKARADSAYAGTGRAGSSRADTVLITRSQDASSNQARTQRIELGTSRYLGAEVNRTYDLGSGISVRVSATGSQSARVVVQTSGNGAPRDDTGSSVASLTDGSFGPSACGPTGDECPNDPNKTSPGLCGCGAPDTDSDGDRTPDCQDGCPTDAAKLQPGACGCGAAEQSCGGGGKTMNVNVRDTFVDSARPSSNFGSSTVLEVDSSPAAQRTYFKPRDWGGLPTGTRLQSAQLVVQVVDAGNDLSVRKLTSYFSQSSTTYNSAPTASSGLVTVSGSIGTKTIDITSIVQSWVEGEAAFGVALYPTGSDGVDLASTESATVASRPFIRITYK